MNDRLVQTSVRSKRFWEFLGFALNLPFARAAYVEILKAQGVADVDALVGRMRQRYRLRMFAIGLVVSVIGAVDRDFGPGRVAAVGVAAMYFGLFLIFVQVLDRFDPGQISVRQMLDAVRGRRT